LILPVVIRLFQGLSHACSSISCYTTKLRIAHYNGYNLVDVQLLYTDNHGNSGANTCGKAQLFGRVVLVGIRTNPFGVYW